MDSRICINRGELEPSNIGSKSFATKVNLNLTLAKVVSSSFPIGSNNLSSDNISRIFFYKHIKILKNFKDKKSNSDLRCYGWKYQLSGLYTSFVEMEKKEKIAGLKDKLAQVKSKKLTASFLQRPCVIVSPLKKKRNMENVSKGLIKFSDFYTDLNEVSFKRRLFFDTLKTRRFFPSIFFSRLFLFAAAGIKKYRTHFFYAFKRKRKIDSLFHLYTLSSLKFRDMKRQRKKFFKKVAWRINREKKWKRRVRVSFALFRLRQKLSQVFYVPKHFEINYKTFTTSYLGYTDFKTVNTKVAFWLNLRKLLTFLT